MIGQATAGRPPPGPGRGIGGPPTPPGKSPTLWASTGSRSWVTPAAARTPWRAPRSAETVSGVVVVAGMAPFCAEGLDWFEGFGPSGAAQLRAAAAGRARAGEALGCIRRRAGFTPEDEAALAGEWSWFIDESSRPRRRHGGVHRGRSRRRRRVGFDPADMPLRPFSCTGGRDRVVPSSHSEWLARRCPSAELWLRPDDGHISVLGFRRAAMTGSGSTPKGG